MEIDRAIPRLLTRQEVADRLGVPLHTFRRRLPELRQRGFPAPILAGRYDPAAIAAWFRSQAGLAPAAEPSPQVAPVTDYEAILAARAAAITNGATR